MFFILVCGCFVCMYVCAPYACLQRPEEGVRSPGTEVELQCGCWEWKSRQYSSTTGPFLQLWIFCFFNNVKIRYQ